MSKRERNKRLLRALLDRGWTQREAARRAGVSAIQFNALCCGRNLPRPETARKIARALGTTPARIGLGEVWR